MAIYELDGISPKLPAHGQYWVAPDANLIGNVELGVQASVWFGATLRGDNEKITVGARSNIQEDCILHTDAGFPLEIGADCTIGHGVILHGCTLGDGVLIGMGAIVLNGAEIPDGCLVGAHALVTEGKVFEKNSLIVGAPARAVKVLEPEALARLKASAAHYAANARRFSAGLKKIG